MNAVLEANEPGARYLAAVEPALVQQFELLATAPKGIARLRELILMLAVKGQLVPQEPSDQTAHESLKRIEFERDCLIATGKVKTPKPTNKVSSEELPFEIPPSWEWAPLSDIVRVLNGRAYAKQELLDAGPTPVLRVGNLFTSDHWYYSNLSLDPDKLCNPGDLLFAWSASFGPFIWDGPKAIFHYHIWKLDPIAPRHFDVRYFHLFLREKTAELKAAGHGVSMVHLTKEKMEKIAVPWPPLAEQARIVARVDELMRLCDALEAQGRLEAEQHARLLGTLLGTLTDSSTPEEPAANWQRVAEHFDLLLDRPEAVDALEQTILQLAVRGLLVPQDEADEPARVVLERINSQRRRARTQSPATLPESDPAEPPYILPSQWAWAQLGDLVENMGSGWSPACEDGERKDPARWAVLRTTSVQVMEYRAHEHKAIPLKFAPRPEIEVKPGDILVTRAGPMNRVGISCWVDQTPARLMLSDKIIRFHPVSDELSPAFVVLALNAGWTRELLEASKTGMAASQVNVSQSDLRSLWIPVCSRNEQARIVARVNDFRRLCVNLRERLIASQVTQSLLAEALVKEVT